MKEFATSLKDKYGDSPLGGKKIIALSLFMLSLAVNVRGELVREVVSYPPEAVAGWAPIDVDRDGNSDLVFEMRGLSYETGGAFILNVGGTERAQVLSRSGRAIDLRRGDFLADSSSFGIWTGLSSETTVWIDSFELNRSVLTGSGMPGYGQFIGLRLMDPDGWHYGWVRFGELNGSPLRWPSVLEYGFETEANVPITVPEPSVALLMCLAFIAPTLKRLAGGRISRLPMN